MRVKTEWRATDSPWWPLQTMLLVALAAVPVVLAFVVEHHQPLWMALCAPALAFVLHLVRIVRRRVRLTEAGVEVRGLRTRVYRWSDIASVERAPEWSSTSVIWLRLRGSVPSAAPEVLAPPGLGGRGPTDRALDHIVAEIERRTAPYAAPSPRVSAD